MNFNNVIYLITNKIYFKNQDQILELSFSKDIIYELKKDQFIKKYLLFLKQNHLKTLLFYQKITIIYDSTLSIHDCNYLLNLFYEIGYYKVILKSDVSFLNISKENAYLIIDKTYKLLYRDNYNQKKQLIINPDILSSKEISNIIKKRIKKNIIIIGNYKNNLLLENYYVINNRLSIFFEKQL